MAKTEKQMFPREFVEWWLWGSHPFVPWFDKQGAFLTDEITDKRYSLDDMYTYWRLVIEPKNKEDESK